jgi:VCBS repeat-containing protein
MGDIMKKTIVCIFASMLIITYVFSTSGITEFNKPKITASAVKDESYMKIAQHVSLDFKNTQIEINNDDKILYEKIGLNEETISNDINPLNNPPIANDDYYSTNEETTLNVLEPGVLQNDTDPENDLLIAVLNSNVIHGTLILNPNGAFTYTPDYNFYGIDSFTYRAKDGENYSNIATVTITVNPVNDAPIAFNDFFTTDEDTILNVIAPGVLNNDTDIENDPLTAILISDVSHGTLNLSSNGGFEYTPDINYFGSDSFTYKANDGSANSNTATVTITITPVNDPPLANDDYYSTDEDNTLTVSEPGILLNDTDVENDLLTVEKISDVSHGTLNLNPNGGFDYIPDNNYYGIDSFTYQAYDGNDYSNTATVTITIVPVNDAPVANNDYYSTDEEITLIIPAPGILNNDTDVEGDSLNVTLINDVTHGTLNLSSDGGFEYTNDINYFGTDSFTYQAYDGDKYSFSAAVMITINPINDPPTIPNNPDPYDGETYVFIYLNISWNGGDPDGDDVLYDVYFGDSNPPPKVISKQATTNYNPGTLDFDTIYYWQIVAWDELNVSTTGPIWNFTTRPNDPPNVPSDPVPALGSTSVGINSNLRWTGGDPDDDPVTYDLYFGTTTPPPLIDQNLTSNAYEPGTLNYSTTYYWKIISFDQFDTKTEGPIWYFSTEENTNKNPLRPTVTGIQGIHVPNVEYDYDIVTTDPDGDDILYYIDWGDGSHEDWFGPFESGDNITKKHSWPEVTRLYEIKVKAKDIYNAESIWASLFVFVLNSRSVSSSILIRFIVRLLDRFPILQKILTSGPLLNRLIR